MCNKEMSFTETLQWLLEAPEVNEADRVNSNFKWRVSKKGEFQWSPRSESCWYQVEKLQDFITDCFVRRFPPKTNNDLGIEAYYKKGRHNEYTHLLDIVDQKIAEAMKGVNKCRPCDIKRSGEVGW